MHEAEPAFSGDVSIRLATRHFLFVFNVNEIQSIPTPRTSRYLKARSKIKYYSTKNTSAVIPNGGLLPLSHVNEILPASLLTGHAGTEPSF